MKKSLLAFILVVFSSSHAIIINAQIAFCGIPDSVYSGPLPIDPDSLSQDIFGNLWPAYDPITTPSTTNCTNTGYFILDFNDLDPVYYPAICEVFKNVSDLIEQRQLTTNCGDLIPLQPVYIDLMEGGNGSAALARALPQYPMLDSPPNCTPLELSKAYIKINGGTASGTLDGTIWINDTPPTAQYPLGNQDNWHFEYTMPVLGGKYDLYSVILHEVGHILGFSSLIGAAGPSSEQFSLYDEQLFAVDQVNGSGKVLVSDCISNCWNLNSALFNDYSELDDLLNDQCMNG